MVEARSRNLFTERITMLIVGLILLPVAVYFAVGLLYRLAIFALPVFAAFSIAFIAYHHGSGVMAAIFAGLAAGFGVFLVGQVAFRLTSSRAIRAALALIFVAPAVLAGYYATLGLEHLVASSNVWCQPLAILCAAAVGWTSAVKLAGSPGNVDWAGAWRVHRPSADERSTHPSPVPDART
jgi:hypothetical protein